MNDIRSTLENTLARQLHWIGAADGKIGPVLAIDTTMLGVFGAVAPNPGEWNILLGFLGACTLVLLGLSVFHLFAAGFPRTRGPERSLVYFGGITQRTEEEFIKDVLETQEGDYVRDLAKQCYRNAQIAGDKFRHVKRATVMLLAALLPWAMSIYAFLPLR